MSIQKYFDIGLFLMINHSLLAQWIKMNSSGKLVYNTCANTGQSNVFNRIPDFSYAGYKSGGVAIPFVKARAAVTPGPGDDAARIQTTIDRVSGMPVGSAGFRGAILLKAGTYLGRRIDTYYYKWCGVKRRRARGCWWYKNHCNGPVEKKLVEAGLPIQLT